MEKEEILRTLDKEYSLEQQAFIERFGVTPQQVEPSFLHLKHLEERYYFIWTTSGSATASA